MSGIRKKISAVIGEYQKDGQTKAEWADVGVILQSNNGKEYMLLNTEISLSGVLAKQNVLAMSKNEKVRDNVMCSIIEDSNQGQQNNNQQQQSGYQQQGQQPQGQQTAQQHQQPQPQPQQGYDNGGFPQI